METTTKTDKATSSNLELVLGSISEDLRSSKETTAHLAGIVEKLNGNLSGFMENQKSNAKKNDSDMQVIRKEFQEVMSDIKGITFPEKAINDLSEKIKANSLLLKNPAETKVLHHHHVPKIILIATVLFIAFSLALAILYVTNNKLNAYIENDTKYRHLRLDTGNPLIQINLDKEDSLYNTTPDLRKMVLQTEEDYLQNFERLQKADRLKAEAKDLEREARGK
jgi:hypothetical protein